MDVGCYAEFAETFIKFVGDNSVLRRVIAGVLASKEIIMGLCVLALGTTRPELCDIMNCFYDFLIVSLPLPKHKPRMPVRIR